MCLFADHSWIVPKRGSSSTSGYVAQSTTESRPRGRPKCPEIAAVKQQENCV